MKHKGGGEEDLVVGGHAPAVLRHPFFDVQTAVKSASCRQLPTTSFPHGSRLRLPHNYIVSQFTNYQLPNGLNLEFSENVIL
jgi:hypothetical protein